MRAPTALRLLTTALALHVAGADSALPQAAPTETPSKLTARVVRETGVAMWQWLADQLPQGLSDAAAAKLGAPEWGECLTSAEELSQLLVPKYMAVLPRTDGWGQDLQYCLRFDHAHPDAEHASLGVRSPGSDGRFSTSAYEIGSFEPTATDQDTVWANGYFLRWPQKHAAAN